MNQLNERLANVRRQIQIYYSEIERIERTTNDIEKINWLNAKITIAEDEERKLLKELGVKTE